MRLRHANCGSMRGRSRSCYAISMDDLTELTEQQRRFVTNLVSEGLSGAEAARRAGYGTKNARIVASQLLRKVHVAEAIRREQGRVLSTLGGKALRVIDQLLDDPEAPAGVRLDAAKTVLDRVGLVSARTPVQPVLDDRPMTEMDVAELRALVAALKPLCGQAEPPTLN